VFARTVDVVGVVLADARLADVGEEQLLLASGRVRLPVIGGKRETVCEMKGDQKENNVGECHFDLIC